MLREQPGATTAEVAFALENTGTDAGRSLAQWLRDNEGVIAAIGLLVALFFGISDMLENSPEPDGLTPEEIAVIVEKVIDEADVHDRSTGRNDRCPCESGLKFKKCHGVPDSVRRQREAARGAAEGDGAAR